MRPLLLLALLSLTGCSLPGDSALPAAKATAAEEGPPLTVPESELQASLVCSGELRDDTRAPVLLIPGTTLDPQSNFDWNYLPALQALGWPHCTVELPGNAMGDIQTAAEHVVYAIREMHRASGRRIQILGYSQGGMIPRWALRWWPQTREMVEELVSLSGSHHGTVSAIFVCLPGCAPAFWQQASDSAFNAALNAEGDTYPEVDYTSIYTRYDEVVVPNLAPSVASSVLAGGDNVVNVATQDVCPLNAAEHLAIGSYDPVAYALALDALTHVGPADPSRVGLAVCLELFMPGVNPAGFAVDFARYLGVIVQTIAAAPQVPEEPPLRCYAGGVCP